MWEETGLYVELTRLIGVFGGRACTSTYSNGDALSWVSTAFAGRRLRGEVHPDGDEVLETRYFAPADTRRVPCKPHVAMFLDAAWPPRSHAQFPPATWRPEQ